MDKSIFNNKPYAYISALGGIELYGVEYGINDKLYYTVGAWTGKPTKHATQIYYSKKGFYIKVCGTRQYLHNAIRI